MVAGVAVIVLTVAIGFGDVSLDWIAGTGRGSLTAVFWACDKPAESNSAKAVENIVNVRIPPSTLHSEYPRALPTRESYPPRHPAILLFRVGSYVAPGFSPAPADLKVGAKRPAMPR